MFDKTNHIGYPPRETDIGTTIPYKQRANMARIAIITLPRLQTQGYYLFLDEYNNVNVLYLRKLCSMGEIENK